MTVVSSVPSGFTIRSLRADLDDTVAARIDLGPGFISGGVLIAFGSIWLSDFTHPRIIRIPYPN